MKKIFLLFASIFILTGCNTISNVNADDYLTSTPKNVESNMVGIWVGAMGPYLNTMKINSNGTGLYCYSWNGKNVLNKLIYDGKNIIVQSGEKLEVDNFNSNEMNITANYYVSAKYKFYKDDNLHKSSIYCKAELSK